MLGGIVGPKVGFDRSFPKMMTDFLEMTGFLMEKSQPCGPRASRKVQDFSDRRNTKHPSL